jgi:toxin FitB
LKYLLDTCAISELIKPEPNNNVLQWFQEETESNLYLSVLTIGEIRK